MKKCICCQKVVDELKVYDIWLLCNECFKNANNHEWTLQETEDVKIEKNEIKEKKLANHI